MQRTFVGSLALVALLSCARPTPPEAMSHTPAPRWLCRPDTNEDPCANADLTATERASGPHEGAVVPHVRATQPKADCFYVYPTVDLELVPGNHENLDDNARVLATTLAQAGRFTETCSLWVPLYRQITLGSWLQPTAERERLLTVAFADVERAFEAYLAQSGKRPIVLVGHSQGAEMVVRLLRRFFGSAEMRARLLLAMPIGGEVEVPQGKTRGATLDIPICSRPMETGCVVAYRTHYAKKPVDPSRWAPRQGNETVCVDPAALDRGTTGPHLLAHAYFPAHGELARFLHGVSDVVTPYAMYSSFYDAQCVRGARGYTYLAVDAEREGPLDLGSKRFDLGKLGLHVLDLQLAQGDLVALVARRVAALP